MLCIGFQHDSLRLDKLRVAVKVCILALCLPCGIEPFRDRIAGCQPIFLTEVFPEVVVMLAILGAVEEDGSARELALPVSEGYRHRMYVVPVQATAFREDGLHGEYVKLDDLKGTHPACGLLSQDCGRSAED